MQANTLSSSAPSEIFLGAFFLVYGVIGPKSAAVAVMGDVLPMALARVEGLRARSDELALVKGDMPAAEELVFVRGDIISDALLLFTSERKDTADSIFGALKLERMLLLLMAETSGCGLKLARMLALLGVEDRAGMTLLVRLSMPPVPPKVGRLREEFCGDKWPAIGPEL